MIYAVELRKSAKASLERLHPADARRAALRLIELETKPLMNSKKLVGNLEGLHSTRVGPIRIIFEIFEDESLIVVERIDYRGQVYR